MTKKEKRACVVCEGEMLWDTRDDVLTYQEKTKTIQSIGYWREECGEAIFEREALQKSERVFMDLQRKIY